MLNGNLRIEIASTDIDVSKIPDHVRESLARTIYDAIRRAHANPEYEAGFQKWLLEKYGQAKLDQYLAEKKALQDRVNAEQEAAKQRRREQLLAELAEL